MQHEWNDILLLHAFSPNNLNKIVATDKVKTTSSFNIAHELAQLEGERLSCGFLLLSLRKKKLQVNNTKKINCKI